MNNQQNNSFLSKSDEKLLNKIAFQWFMSVLFVGSFVSIFSIQTQGLYIFDLLSQITPSINKWVNASNHKNVALAVWIYIVYTSPLIVFLTIYLIRKTNIKHPILFFIFICPIFYISASLFIFGTIFGFDATVEPAGGGSTWIQLYKRYVLGSILFPSFIGAAFIFTFVSLLWPIFQCYYAIKFKEKS